MRHQQPSTEAGTGTDSLYGESDDRTRALDDERALYGEPCHEDGAGCDEQTLYGEPQHETGTDAEEVPDLDLLFVRMRAEPITGPTAVFQQDDSPAATTE